MVSTRHSSAMARDVARETISVPRTPMARSPSPKKRRLDSSTPDETFVDARATPFADRETSPVKAPIEDTSPSAQPRIKSGNSSNTKSYKSSQLSSQVNADNGSASESVSESEDDAPEVVSNTTSAKAAKALEVARLEEARTRDEEARVKRRKRDEKLRDQKAHIRESEKQVEPLAANKTEEADEPEKPEQGTRKKAIPRMLPDDILNAPQTSLPPPKETEIVKIAKHTKFELKPELTRVRKGNMTMELLRKQRRDLAPKKSASTANTRNQWLYQRGEHSLNRRPIKQPLK